MKAVVYSVIAEKAGVTKAERLALHYTRIARTSFCPTCIKSAIQHLEIHSTDSVLASSFRSGFFLSCTRPRIILTWPTANPAIMLSLVLMILFVHIAIYLINTIGAPTIDLLVRLS
jgi:hypothetical protein